MFLEGNMSGKGVKGRLMGSSSVVNANEHKDKKHPVSRCSHASLQFPVGRIHRQLKARMVVDVHLKSLRKINNVHIVANLMAIVQSRRLGLFHLGSGSQQARLFGTRTTNMLKVEGNMAQASAIVRRENLQDWSKKDNRKLLHVVYRVGDLDKTMKFYRQCWGMKLLRKRDIPEERYTNAFRGFGLEEMHFMVELTYNYEVDKYDLGIGFGHFDITVEVV
eukprot:Gb_29800 [translate_table: standard]